MTTVCILPLSIACELCGAAAGEKCRNSRGRSMAPHSYRVELARRMSARAQRARPPGRYECTHCGVRLDEPTRHYAIHTVECPAGDSRIVDRGEREVTS